MSTFLKEEARRGNDPVKNTIWYGVLAKNVADFTDLAFVILPDYSPDHSWGGCFWQARDDVTLPAKGDKCIVAFDNRNQPWIMAWWPF